MSKLIVEVCEIVEIKPHPNADRLELARIKNWQCVVGKDSCKVGDKVVYLPPDSVIPTALAERWGIAKYCAMLPKECNGERPDKLRIRASRFRGEPSFGTVQKPDDAAWAVGTDVQEHYGVEKYEPPLRSSDGDAAPPIGHFHAYTSLEHLGNFPEVLKEGEEVVVTEKLHGTNSRVGSAVVFADDGTPTWEWMAGSHGVRRKEFNDKGVRSMYWLPFFEEAEKCPLRRMISEIALVEQAESAVIVFGEILGVGIQDMTYGQTGKVFRGFDIAVDGRYLDYDVASGYFDEFDIEKVPLLYRGPFSKPAMDELVDGPTTMASPDQIKEPFKGREGIVIRPVKDRNDVQIGRALLKYVSADYHDRKNSNKTEDH